MLQLLWTAFSQINPTIGAGIIAAAATVVVSVASILVAKRLEFRAIVAKEHREKKTPFYEDMVKFIFRITFSDKLGLPPLSEEDMIKQMASFTENLVVWGADDVIDAWFKFRNNSIKGESSGITIMFDIENLLLAIRQDLGHPNKGLTKGKILGLFINDIHDHIK
ncbi:hypothetical protein [Chitinilyticum piscinae]|uniref:Uncharacterized protein n=1 Tax=Chitinilyticum piscinae TaxID=2866724 RepID=A0A8J7K2I4_9NEIS|nr:hypothetical protein [Chitinilyticum piscinae]MBE9610072.1 hypothetical protein [Chitinilyticum piscinae]